MSAQDPVSGRWYTGRPMYTPADAERERLEAARICERWKRRDALAKTWWWRFLVWLRVR